MQLDEFFEKNKITGVTGNSGAGKSTFMSEFKLSKQCGVVNNDIIKCNIVKDQIEYFVREYNYRLKELSDRENEIIAMLDIDKSILDESIYDISESELSKVLIASVMLYNPEVMVFDEVLYPLDFVEKTKLLKLLIKLKKFFKKTIIIVSSNIDDIYEFIDNVIIIDNGKVLLHGDKYDVYSNYDLIKEKNIRIPSIVTFIKMMRNKGINVDNVDTINELIKTVYREMR